MNTSQKLLKIELTYCSTLCDITNESNKLNKDLSVIFLGLILSFLFCISSETNSFTWLKLHTPISKSKIEINSLLSDPLTFLRVRQTLHAAIQYCGSVLANFINAGKD